MIDFGTGGFRGVIGDTFTKDTIQKITQAIANIIEKDNSTTPFVVGYDYRFLSDKAALWVSEVLAGNGIKVFLSDIAGRTGEYALLIICIVGLFVPMHVVAKKYE